MCVCVCVSVCVCMCVYVCVCVCVCVCVYAQQNGSVGRLNVSDEVREEIDTSLRALVSLELI